MPDRPAARVERRLLRRGTRLCRRPRRLDGRGRGGRRLAVARAPDVIRARGVAARRRRARVALRCRVRSRQPRAARWRPGGVPPVRAAVDRCRCGTGAHLVRAGPGVHARGPGGSRARAAAGHLLRHRERWRRGGGGRGHTGPDRGRADACAGHPRRRHDRRGAALRRHPEAHAGHGLPGRDAPGRVAGTPTRPGDDPVDAPGSRRDARFAVRADHGHGARRPDRSLCRRRAGVRERVVAAGRAGRRGGAPAPEPAPHPAARRDGPAARARTSPPPSRPDRQRGAGPRVLRPGRQAAAPRRDTGFRRSARLPAPRRDLRPHRRGHARTDLGTIEPLLHLRVLRRVPAPAGARRGHGVPARAARECCHAAARHANGQHRGRRALGVSTRRTTAGRQRARLCVGGAASERAGCARRSLARSRPDDPADHAGLHPVPLRERPASRARTHWRARGPAQLRRQTDLLPVRRGQLAGKVLSQPASRRPGHPHQRHERLGRGSLRRALARQRTRGDPRPALPWRGVPGVRPAARPPPDDPAHHAVGGFCRPGGNAARNRPAARLPVAERSAVPSGSACC